MGIIIKQSIRNAVISYVGIVIGFISTIKLFPNILDPDQFGLTRVMVAIMTISVQLVNLGIPNSIVKYFPSLATKTKNKKGIIFGFLIPPIITLFIFCILLFLLKKFVLHFYDDSLLLSEFYIYLIPLIISYAFFEIFASLAKAYFDTVFVSFLQDILLRVFVIIDLVLFYLNIISFNLFILFFVFNYALQFLLLLIYLIKNNYLSIKPAIEFFDSQLIKDIRSYSLFSFFSGLTMILVGNIDIIMLGKFEGLGQTGIYAIALYVGAVISIPKKAIAKISFPVISDSFNKNDFINIGNVYKQSSLNQFLIGLLIYVGVLANIDNLYAMLPKEYANGSIVIIIIGIAHLFDLVTGANGQIIIASKYYRFDFFSSLVLVITAILLNVLLIPPYGLLGAAIATGTSIFIHNFIKLIYVWFRFKMHPFLWKTSGVLALGITTLFLSQYLPTLPNIYLDILMKSAIISFFYFGIVWVFNLSDEVNNVFRSVIKRVVRS